VLIPHPRKPSDCLRIKKLKQSVSWMPYAPKWGQQEKERKIIRDKAKKAEVL
jgi:hypothetical protein